MHISGGRVFQTETAAVAMNPSGHLPTVFRKQKGGG